MPRQPHDDAADSLRRAVDAVLLNNICESQNRSNTVSTGTVLTDSPAAVSSASWVITPMTPPIGDTNRSPGGTLGGNPYQTVNPYMTIAYTNMLPSAATKYSRMKEESWSPVGIVFLHPFTGDIAILTNGAAVLHVNSSQELRDAIHRHNPHLLEVAP